MSDRASIIRVCLVGVAAYLLLVLVVWGMIRWIPLPAGTTVEGNAFAHTKGAK